MRRAILLGAVFLGLAAPAQAVELVTPAGAPMGGQWQRWANEMRVPTVRRLTLDVSATDAAEFCGAPGACSARGETIVAPGVNRDSFYYELGHQFDWRYLTGADHRFLAREWGDPGAAWEDSPGSVAHHAEDGLEAVFPRIYADCAEGVNDQGSDLETGFINSNYAPPGITPKINTCAWLTRLGVEHHATTVGFRHWTWRLSSHVAPPTTAIGG